MIKLAVAFLCPLLLSTVMSNTQNDQLKSRAEWMKMHPAERPSGRASHLS